MLRADAGGVAVGVEGDLAVRPAHDEVGAVVEAFADWWDGDDGAETVTVTSEDQGSRAERKLEGS